MRCSVVPPNLVTQFLLGSFLLFLFQCGGTIQSEGANDAGTISDTSTANGETSISPSGTPVIAGCQVFPDDNPWNTDISNYSIHADSDAFIARIKAIGSSTLHPDFGTTYLGNPNGIPFMVIDDSEPLVPISFTYIAESDPFPTASEFRYPVPDDPLIEAGGGDQHILLLNRDTCHLFEIFAANKDGEDGSCGNGGWCAGSGAIFDLSSNGLRPDGWTSADAAGLPILPGLIRYDGVVGLGEVRHALRFTVERTQPGYIHPATHEASDGCSDCPPMGLRLRLKADADLSACTDAYKPIMVALQTYGMFVADNGGNMFISGVPDSRWSDDDLHTCFKSLTVDDFDVVDTGPIL